MCIVRLCLHTRIIINRLQMAAKEIACMHERQQKEIFRADVKDVICMIYRDAEQVLCWKEFYFV